MAFPVSTDNSIQSLIALYGFCLAGTMIGHFYINWNKSPITSTVCPPNGSNTALNVDVMAPWASAEESVCLVVQRISTS